VQAPRPGWRDNDSGGTTTLAFGANKPRRTLSPEELYDSGIKLLGVRMRTEAELRKALLRKAAEGPEGERQVDGVIERMREYGYLNDASFAETYTRLRHENEKLGARRVKQDLMRKGVDAELIDVAIGAQYDPAKEESLIRAHLERKRLKKPTNEKESARVMRRLVTAGFSVGAIYRVLRQWDVDEEMLSALESIDGLEE